MSTRDAKGIVYSTDQGQTCPRCNRLTSACICTRRADTAKPGEKNRGPTDGVVRIWREVKGRKGKGVTLVVGLPLSPAELRELASELKRRCGSGGSVKDGVVEIQGDHRDLLLAELSARGYRAKKAGG